MTLFTCILAVFPERLVPVQCDFVMSSEPPAKKLSRRPRFTDAETLALVEEVERRFPVIMGRLDSRVTADTKNRAWEEVTAIVNGCSRIKRTTDELRRKYRDLRAHVKGKAAKEHRHIEGTGKCIGNADNFLSKLSML